MKKPLFERAMAYSKFQILKLLMKDQKIKESDEDCLKIIETKIYIYD